MLVNLYLPALVFLYCVISPNLRNVLSFFLPRPLLLSRPHNFHLTKTSLQWFVYLYSTLSIFQCLLRSSQNNYTNKQISVLHCMSYCTFIKFNLTTRWICSYEVYQGLLLIQMFSTYFISQQHWTEWIHPLPGNILSTWLSVYHNVLACLLTHWSPFLSLYCWLPLFLKSLNLGVLQCWFNALSSLYIHSLLW